MSALSDSLKITSPKLLTGHPRFELIEHDIINPFWTDVDEIYNLACPASPIHYQHDAIKTAKTAVFGTFNMLGLAKRNKAKILQASTRDRKSVV